MKKNLLIVGDSFSADWTKKNKLISGWVNTLENNYKITNLSQAGVGEYKIWLQLSSVDTTIYDKIIICHTSPYRIYIKEHPIHNDDVLHYNCDLIYNDLLEYKNNQICSTAVNFFQQIYDLDYANFLHKLLIKEILVTYPSALNISFFDLQIPNIHYFYDEFSLYRGIVNHLNEDGNEIVYNKICKLLENHDD